MDLPDALKQPFPWYDRYGNRVPLDEWEHLMCDLDYRIVKQENVTGGDGRDYWVSTVFVGIDMGLGFIRGAPPVLFETMIFTQAGGEVIDWGGRECVRYSSLDAARKGHEAAVTTRTMGSLIDQDADTQAAEDTNSP
jgi:hypothetical protein